jgi:hypothetical protein
VSSATRRAEVPVWLRHYDSGVFRRAMGICATRSKHRTGNRPLTAAGFRGRRYVMGPTWFDAL